MRLAAAVLTVLLVLAPAPTAAKETSWGCPSCKTTPP